MKSSFSEMINKIDRCLAKLTMKKRKSLIKKSEMKIGALLLILQK